MGGLRSSVTGTEGPKRIEAGLHDFQIFDKGSGNLFQLDFNTRNKACDCVYSYSSGIFM